MEKIRLVIFLLVALPLVSTRNVRKDFSADSKESFPPRHRVNKYIRDVYKRVRRNEDGTMNIEIQKQKAKVDEICGYQTVKGGQYWGVDHAHFDFNTSDLGKHDTVMAAEFVLTARRGFPSQPVNVTILVRRESNNQTAFKSLGWQVLHWFPSRLLIFDVKQAVEYWRVAQQLHGELMVRVKNVGANDSGLQAGSTHTQSAFRRGATDGPFLVVYLKHSKENARSPDQLDLITSTLPVTEDSKFVSPRLSPYGFQGKLRAGSSPPCRKSSLRLVLPNLFSWIIDPDYSINLGQCDGLCVSPLGSSVSPTKHAILIADLLKKRGVREPKFPCCVAVELTGRTIVYFDNKQKIKVKTWKNLIVKKCGCR